MRSSTMRALLVAGALAAAVPVAAATVNAWTNVGPEGGALREIVRAAAPSMRAYARTKYDVYRSDDGGANWTRLEFSSQGEVIDIAVATGQPQTLFLATGPGSGTVSEWKLLRSTDGGATFTDLPLTNRDFISVVAVNPNGQVVYTIGPVYGAQRSNNGGNTWSIVTVGYPRSAVQSNVYDRAHTLSISPVNSSYVIALTSSKGAYRTVDGVNWAPLANGFPGGNFSFQADVAHHPTIANEAVALSYWYPMRSIDSGASWTLLDCCAASAFRINSDSSYTVAAQDGRVLRSADTGATWQDIGAVGLPPATELDVPIGAPEQVLVGTPRGTYLTVDGGANWLQGNGIAAASITGVARSASDEDLMLASSATLGILRSTDRGVTWIPSNIGLPTRTTGIGICDVTFDHDDPDRAYAILHAGTLEADIGLYRSDDGGISWTQVVSRDFNGCRRLFSVAGSPDVLVALGSGIDRSIDGGVTWTDVLGGGVSAMAVVADQPQVIWQSNSGGTFRSTDGGATFNLLREAGADGAPYALAVSPDDANTVYGVTATGRLIRTEDGGTTWTVSELGSAFFAQGLRLEIAIDAEMPNELVIGTASGTYRSPDRGRTWERISRGSGAASIAPDTRGAAFSVTQDGGGRALLVGAEGGSNPGVFRMDLATDIGVAYAGDAAYAVGAPLVASFSVSKVSGYLPSAFSASVTIDPPLPSTVVTMTGADCTGAAGAYTCSGEGLPSGLVNVSAAPVAIGDHTIAVTIDTDLADPVSTNDAVEVAVAVQTGADLRLSATQPTAKKHRGDKLKYLVTVTNDGPATATGVLLDANVPSNLNYLSATIDGAACVRLGAGVRCTKASLAPGASTVATLTFKARAKGIATFSASATSAVPDPDAADATRTLTKQIYK